MTITAKVIADSISVDGKRITTLLLSYPRFIHAEMMTHRVFSRNASSSRAIPVMAIIKNVTHDMAAPIHWGANQPGMQANSELTGWRLKAAKIVWNAVGKISVLGAKTLAKLGAHKQIANRILEPYAHINVLVTSTEWDNFFNLRIHAAAQPEIKSVAEAMKQVMDWSIPLRLTEGQWHTPFVEPYMYTDFTVRERNMISAARCARLSYTPFGEPKRNTEKDLILAQSLWEEQHLSPFEHQATPKEGWNANFNGWQSFRNLEGF